MLKPNSLNCSMVALGLFLACGGGRGSASGNGTEGSAVSSGVGGKSGAKTLRIPVGTSEGGAGSDASSTGKIGLGGSASSANQTGTAGGEGGADSTDPTGVAGSGASDGIDTEDPPSTSIDTEDPPPKTGDTEDPPGGNTEDPPGGDTGDPPGGDTGDPPPGTTGDPPKECTMTEIDKVNVIIFGDANPSGADVEGRMWVGGNAKFSGYGVGHSKDPNAAPQECTDGEYSLVVGGDLSGQVNADHGSVAVYGEVSGNVTACEVTSEHPVDFEAVEKKLKGYSLAFRDYPVNGDSGVQYGELILSGKDPKLNVINITADQLVGVGSIRIDVPETSSVIINVSGKTVEWGGMGFVMPDGGKACRGDSSDWCHRIVWNLYEAESLTLSGIGVQGSVMAPLATVSGAGGNVDGQLVAQELLGQIEYHPYFFSGCLLLPTS